MIFREALARGRAALAASDIATAALDARLLLVAAANLDMAALIARDQDTVPPLVEARYDTYLKRRAGSEPVARILGQAEFWGLTFKLNSATLVPRPDTETLVEAVLETARTLPPKIAICDLGTGSGAIVIALLTELPEARAIATDISEGALRMARENAETHGVADRIRFERIGFAEGPDGSFEVVVSNPPYIRHAAIGALAKEVREHDALASLDGGTDGLDAYRAILARTGSLLAKGGALAVEVGYDQADSVAALCRRAGLGEVSVRRDLAGHGRVVIAGETLFQANPKAAKKALGKVG